MKIYQFLILGAAAAFLGACASVPPKELVNARSAFRSASEGPAQQLVPAELHKAQAALALAEESAAWSPAAAPDGRHRGWAVVGRYRQLHAPRTREKRS